MKAISDFREADGRQISDHDWNQRCVAIRFPEKKSARSDAPAWVCAGSNWKKGDAVVGWNLQRQGHHPDRNRK